MKNEPIQGIPRGLLYDNQSGGIVLIPPPCRIGLKVLFSSYMSQLFILPPIEACNQEKVGTIEGLFVLETEIYTTSRSCNKFFKEKSLLNHIKKTRLCYADFTKKEIEEL